MKIIGIITAWGNEDWIEAAIKQGLNLCDELHVCVTAHSDRMLKYEDETYNIVKRYESEIKLLEYNKRSFHAPTKADILNTCMLSSEYFKEGNWIWILDVDEFYLEDVLPFIKKVISADICDKMHVEARFFYINTKHYLRSEHDRLFRINDRSNKFFPTQQWPHATKVLTIPLDFGMFHYSMLMSPYFKMDFWKSEYLGNVQNHKTEWLDKIYRNYDLNNEEYWLGENKELSGNYGPWISDAFVPDKDGTLFRYSGKHPKWISKSLLDVRDFREYWEF